MLPNHSRIWIYQSNRVLSSDEIAIATKKLSLFCTEWTAHNNQLHAHAEIIYNRFIILMVDEGVHNASGCSIDKSVRFLKELEIEFNINLFDRMQLAYKNGDEIITCNRNEFENRIQKGEINADTIVFNNLVTTKAALATEWEVPLKDSWHKQVFAL